MGTFYFSLISIILYLRKAIKPGTGSHYERAGLPTGSIGSSSNKQKVSAFRTLCYHLPNKQNLAKALPACVAKDAGSVGSSNTDGQKPIEDWGKCPFHFIGFTSFAALLA